MVSLGYSAEFSNCVTTGDRKQLIRLAADYSLPITYSLLLNANRQCNSGNTFVNSFVTFVEVKLFANSSTRCKLPRLQLDSKLATTTNLRELKADCALNY
ncbi:unnamed protein product [Caenorhabditis angaria]|uniref:Uncharacterized protein n=1 Tax=Caenorhabditis angaria TaxID=860376 RepID=A0A9P1IB43_9PELO|nr:unnamed protein product [Caenorhabditis angaria]